MLNFDALESQLYVSGTALKLGSVSDQTIYAMRPQPGCDLNFPFEKKPFTALIRTSSQTTEADMRRAGWQLLQHGLRHGICHGEKADRMSEILDEIIDSFDISDNNQTAFSSSHEGEDISETMEYFLLPSGLADSGLILVLGTDNDWGGTMDSFDNLVGSGEALLELVTDESDDVWTEELIEADAVLC